MTKAILYARTSAADAAADRSPEEMYLVPLRRQAEAKGWTVALELLDRSPRPDGPRPELERAGKLIAEGSVQVFATPALTHPFQSPFDMARVLHRWTELGVTLVSLAELLDGTVAAGKLRQHDLANTLWNFISASHGERTRAGIVLSAVPEERGAGAPSVVYNALEIKDLYEKGYRGRFLSQTAMVRHIKRTGGRMSKGLMTKILTAMRAAGELDESAREQLRLAHGPFHKGKPPAKIGYDAAEIRQLLLLGYGARRVLRVARSLPKRATLQHARRICDTVRAQFPEDFETKVAGSQD